MLQAAISESGDDRSPITISLQAALLNVARWDLDSRPVMRPILKWLEARAEGGEDLNPQLHANLAIELGAAGLDRERAISHAREAVLAMPRLMSRTSTALATARPPSSRQQAQPPCGSRAVFGFRAIAGW